RVGERRLGAVPDRIVLNGRTHLRWKFGGDTRVLLLGHHDTVWPIGSITTHPFSVADGVLRGPGCFDMKAGLAMAGMHPVVAMYATFLNRGFDQLLMDVALHVMSTTTVTGTSSTSVVNTVCSARNGSPVACTRWTLSNRPSSVETRGYASVRRLPVTIAAGLPARSVKRLLTCCTTKSSTLPEASGLGVSTTAESNVASASALRSRTSSSPLEVLRVRAHSSASASICRSTP
ncbi:hypothetical protein ACFQ1S_38760, partial [Kibdelosporangium lantanae]